MSISYRVEMLPGEPILFAELGRDYVFRRDFLEMQARAKALIDSAESRVYVVFDARELHLGFDDLVQGVNTSSRGENALFHHPNIIKIIGVTNSAMIKLAVKGMNNEIFGNMNIAMFSTPEEALAHAREQAAIAAG